MKESIKKEKILFADEDDEETNEFGLNSKRGDSTNALAINKKYAERYDNWRGKEEMQKCEYSLSNRMI